MQSELTFSSRFLHKDPHSAQPEKLIHFACQFRTLGSGMVQIRKKCQIPEDLRILSFF
jgi:hypothetical protein